MLEQAAFAVNGMSWQKQLITPPAKGKGEKWYIRFPSTGSLTNRHVLVLSATSKHPLSLLHKGPHYVKII